MKKSSWHYWLTSKYFSHVSDNICGYFWQVVISCFSGLSAAIFVFGVALATGYILAYPILQFFFGYDAFFALLSACMWIVIGWALYEKRPKKQKVAKEKSLLSQYISAKRGKFCKKIVFED